MREIMFRGKRKDNSEWIEGYLVKLGRESFSDPERYGICNNAIPLWGSRVCYNLKIDEVIPETVGQYTGVNVGADKLFEGDIVEWHEDYDDAWGYSQTAVCRSVVIWDAENFCWEFQNDDKYIQPFNDWSWNNSYIIGNKWDNPELLKGGEG